MIKYLVEFVGTFIFLSIILTLSEAIHSGFTLVAVIYLVVISIHSYDVK